VISTIDKRIWNLKIISIKIPILVSVKSSSKPTSGIKNSPTVPSRFTITTAKTDFSLFNLTISLVAALPQILLAF